MLFGTESSMMHDEFEDGNVMEAAPRDLLPRREAGRPSVCVIDRAPW